MTSADMALPAQDERTMPAVVLTGLDRKPLDEALTEIHALTEQHGYLVVVCSQATPDPVVRRL
ncbi:hypothetical protein GCM10017687_61710 [Streptomyces echinatus]